MNSLDKHLEQRARELYHEASQRIDPVTAGRLRAARRHALAAAQAPKHHATRWLIPTGAFAAIALATLMVWQPVPHDTVTSSKQVVGMPGSSVDMDTELPPDADKTDPNLYQNLDFYGWLAANGSPHDQPAKH
ncbi:hypothetical protein [Rhodanobacter sp. MP7CTX1]|jgi:hypothetical protein|uniref:hypothetical protein n=1 Tax=Rhodanobacter sp. MP7CTX1 TaxID=2723084 RepID=UPI00160B700E|nr:hypothetical protein [Rhodanobacter sp. MP7CTX1]MBB6189296.1 hypothetical protein [Rhodanobacter sp. MP7CTX1]